MTADPGRVGYHRELLDLLRALKVRSSEPTDQAIARIVGAAPGYVADVLAGIEVPSETMAAALAKALGGDHDEQLQAARYAGGSPAARAGLERVSSERAARGDIAARRDATAAVTLAYVEQVRQIAPDVLLDREQMLHDLAGFCTGDDVATPYVWWRAPAWAGKSALLSWFVLHPPPGVQVLSFFITARLAGQDNRRVFAEVLLAQLAELLGEQVPGQLTDATRDVYVVELLRRASAACVARGIRLVLLVDGLDEDRGVMHGVDRYSIASLLPVKPPAGLRVVVAGRPNPPIPDDVPHHHPLRDPDIVRTLEPSPHADQVRSEAERELKRLLRGDRIGQDLLGVVTAAQGGLSSRDLAELLEVPEWDILERLDGIAGRTFVRRPSLWRPAVAPDVYLLGHEELQQAAVRFLDGALGRYREQLHGWADAYRRRGWPDDAPEYLLRGYFGMLQQDRNLRRLVECACDAGRHDRMRERIGGDAAAIGEIDAVMDELLAGTADLQDMARLAVHRGVLVQRNENLPTELPALWARLGQPGRAEALARSIIDPGAQAEALIGVLNELAAGDHRARTASIAAQARAMLAAVPAGHYREHLVWQLSGALARLGRHDEAGALARTIAEPSGQVQALVAVADALAEDGLIGPALAVAHDAMVATRSATNSEPYAAALAAVARIHARAGDRDTAVQRAAAIPIAQRQAAALAALAVGAATAEAVAILERMTDPIQRVDACVTMIGRAVSGGDGAAVDAFAECGEAVLGDIRPRLRRVESATALAVATMRAGRLSHATRVLEDARDVVASMAADLSAPVGHAMQHLPGSSKRAQRMRSREEWLAEKRRQVQREEHAAAQVVLCKALARMGMFDAAERLAADINELDRYGECASILVSELAKSGAVSRAETMVEFITNPVRRAAALTDLAEYATGDSERLAEGELVRVAQLAIRDIVGVERRVQALVRLAQRVHAGGNPRRADEVLSVALRIVAESVGAAEEQPPTRPTIELAVALSAMGRPALADAAVGLLPTSASRAETFVRLAADAMQRNEPDAAVRLASEAERSAWDEMTADQRSEWLAVLVPMLVGRERLTRARAVARAIPDPARRGQAVADVAVALAERGELQAALQLVGTIDTPHQRAAGMARLISAVRSREVAADLVIHAETAITEIGEEPARFMAWITLARAAAAVGVLLPLERVEAEAEGLHRGVRRQEDRAAAVAAAVELLVAYDRRKEADRVARIARTWLGRSTVYGRYAVALAARGDFAAAAQPLALVHPGPERARTLTELAGMAAGIGEQTLAAAYARDARSEAGGIDEPYRRALALIALATVHVRAGHERPVGAIWAEATSAAAAVRKVGQRAQVQTALVRLAATAGWTDRIRPLSEAAEATALTLPKAVYRAAALSALTVVLAEAGLVERAEEVANADPDVNGRAEALTALAATIVAATGPGERVDRLVASAFRLSEWTIPWSLLATIRPDVVSLIAADVLTGPVEDVT